MNTSVPRRAAFLTVIAAAAGLTACGGASSDGTSSSDPREQVVTVVHEYQNAIIDRDGDALCELFTGRKKRAVIASTAPMGGITSCAETVDTLSEIEGADDLARRRASRDATTASNVTMQGPKTSLVTFSSGKTLPLVKVADDWLIDASAE